MAFNVLHLVEIYHIKGNKTPFKRALEELIGEGVDTDTNTAVVGALVGAYLGFKDQMPQIGHKILQTLQLFNRLKS